jgi:Fur family ferric uptake transcriptional regulator
MHDPKDKQMISTKHKRILEECYEFLNLNGYAVTQELSELLVYFFSADRHLSFEEIKHYTHNKKLDITDSQIRDSIEILVVYGFATVKDFGDGIPRYEHLHYGEHHDHFYCLKCGLIIEFYSPLIEAQQHTEAMKKGFHPFSHKMQISGLCEKCFGKSSAHTIPLSRVESGAKFIISDVKDSSVLPETGIRKKLLDLGLIPGCKGEVLTNTGGRIVIILNGSRLALGHAMSQSIQVSLTE